MHTAQRTEAKAIIYILHAEQEEEEEEHNRTTVGWNRVAVYQAANKSVINHLEETALRQWIDSKNQLISSSCFNSSRIVHLKCMQLNH